MRPAAVCDPNICPALRTACRRSQLRHRRTRLLGQCECSNPVVFERRQEIELRDVYAATRAENAAVGEIVPGGKYFGAGIGGSSVHAEQGLTSELSAAAKRRRLERSVRRQQDDSLSNATRLPLIRHQCRELRRAEPCP